MLDRALAAANLAGATSDLRHTLTVVRTPSDVWNKTLSVVWDNAMHGGRAAERPDRGGWFRDAAWFAFVSASNH